MATLAIPVIRGRSAPFNFDSGVSIAVEPETSIPGTMDKASASEATRCNSEERKLMVERRNELIVVVVAVVVVVVTVVMNIINIISNV